MKRAVKINTTHGSHTRICEIISVRTSDKQALEVALFREDGMYNFTDPECGGKMYESSLSIKDIAVADFRKKMRRVPLWKVQEQREAVLRLAESQPAPANKGD